MSDDWYSKTVLPPKDEVDPWETDRTIYVLCRLRGGRYKIAYAEILKCGHYWYDDSSDKWDITPSVTHWTFLPEFKE